MFKYNIYHLLKEIADPIIRENIQGSILWKLRISHMTFYRKVNVKIDEIKSTNEFLEPDLKTIAEIFNTRHTYNPPLTISDLKNTNNHVLKTDTKSI